MEKKRNTVGFSAGEIKKSKAQAFLKIKEFLDADDVDGQFDDRDGEYHSRDKFLVTWSDNWKRMASEFGIDKCDSFYTSYSGNKAIFVTRSLFHEKQLGGYASIERALIDVAIKKLCPKDQKQEFFDKYVTKYNERLRKLKEEKTEEVK